MTSKEIAGSKEESTEAENLFRARTVIETIIKNRRGYSKTSFRTAAAAACLAGIAGFGSYFESNTPSEDLAMAQVLDFAQSQLAKDFKEKTEILNTQPMPSGIKYPTTLTITLSDDDFANIHQAAAKKVQDQKNAANALTGLFGLLALMSGGLGFYQRRQANVMQKRLDQFQPK